MNKTERIRRRFLNSLNDKTLHNFYQYSRIVGDFTTEDIIADIIKARRNTKINIILDVYSQN